MVDKGHRFCRIVVTVIKQTYIFDGLLADEFSELSFRARAEHKSASGLIINKNVNSLTDV